jgi:ADP-ribosyl-[dinitrogen reductase] hydrolase
MLANTLGRHDRHSPYNAPVVPGEPDSTDYVMNPWKEKSREQIETTAYVEHSLEAAKWCVWKTRNFEDAVKRAVNLAGASASIGALTGQLAGAIYGAHAIPSEWLESLALRDGIIDLTDMLFDQSLAEKPDK